MNHAHHAVQPTVTRQALDATRHCLTGCAIGEVVGLLISGALGFTTEASVVAGIVLAFVFGYSFTFVPLLRGGMALGRAASLTLAADTISIVTGPGGGPLDFHWGQFLGAGLIILFTTVNILGTRLGGGLQVVGSGLKVALIAGIVLGGLASSQGRVANFQTSLPAHTGGIVGFFVALVAALWAYDGWTNASMIGSDIRNPEKNLPRALIWGTAGVIAIYVLTNVAYLYVLSAPEVGGKTTPLAPAYTTSAT